MEEKTLELYQDKFQVFECQIEDIEMYQVKMFYYQQIPGIRKFRFSMSQHKCFLYFKNDVSVSFVDFLAKGATSNEILKVLEQIKFIIATGESYLLYEDNFCLNPQWIRIKQEQAELKVDILYLPFKKSKNELFGNYYEKFIGLLSKTYNELDDMEGFYYFARVYQEIQEGNESLGLYKHLEHFLSNNQKNVQKQNKR